jgi:hypothetical protein
MRTKEAQLADMAASQAKIAQVAAKPSAETLARGGAGLPVTGLIQCAALFNCRKEFKLYH